MPCNKVQRSEYTVAVSIGPARADSVVARVVRHGVARVGERVGVSDVGPAFPPTFPALGTTKQDVCKGDNGYSDR